MQSIGERLEEARKRRGISIREASEATKIRGDFLLSFENNQFEVGLPEIYVRGFLRNYAGFLKIEADKIVTDFNATLIGEAKSARKDSRELFGRLELPERPRPAPAAGQPPGADGPAAPNPARRHSEDTMETARDTAGPDLVMYMKIGGIIVAGIMAILVIVWLVQSIIRAGGSTDAGPRGSDVLATTPAESETVTLIALDDVRVQVVQVSNNEELFDGPLARGERHTLRKSGRINITYTVGSNLRVEQDGKEYRMPIDGPGRSYFPP